MKGAHEEQAWKLQITIKEDKQYMFNEIFKWKEAHDSGCLIFAAKCGDNCLIVLVTFSLNVLAKL